MDEHNPYRAPDSAVADPQAAPQNVRFAREPRSMSAARGLEWLREAWQLFKAQPLKFLAIMLLMLGVSLALAQIPYVGGVLQNLAWPVAAAVVVLVCESVRRRDEDAPIQAPLQAALTSLLLLAAISALIGLGLSVMVALPILGGETWIQLYTGNVPQAWQPPPKFWTAMGLIWLCSIPLLFASWFAPALIVLHKVSPFNAMALSLWACLRNLPAIIIYGLIVAVLMIPATLPMGLGWLLLGPVMMIGVYIPYRDIFFEA